MTSNRKISRSMEFASRIGLKFNTPFYHPMITPENKKYSVIVDRKNDNPKLIHFGSVRKGVPMAQFKDRTEQAKYKKYDHGDSERRKRYVARHSAIKLKDGTPAINDREQPAFWALRYLW